MTEKTLILVILFTTILMLFLIGYMIRKIQGIQGLMLPLPIKIAIMIASSMGTIIIVVSAMKLL